MPAATRQGDNCTGHDACPPVPLVEGSPNVFTNGQPAGRVGDAVSIGGSVQAGSGNVFIGG